MTETEKKIEALLFYKNEPMSAQEIARLLRLQVSLAEEALASLRQAHETSGIVLLEKNGEYMFGTTPEAAPLLENIRKEEISKELTKASLETIALIAYRGEVTRADIGYIRGVNSSFILRSLLVRGLIEKIPHPKDARTYLYRPSFDLLAFMGATTPQDFPDYDRYHNEIIATLSGNDIQANEVSDATNEQ